MHKNHEERGGWTANVPTCTFHLQSNSCRKYTNSITTRGPAHSFWSWQKKSSIQKDDTKGPLGWRERRINLTPEHLPQKKTWIIQKRRRRRNGKIKWGEGREARLSEAEEPRDEYTSRHGTSKLRFPHLLAVSPPRPTKKKGQPKWT